MNHDRLVRGYMAGGACYGIVRKVVQARHITIKPKYDWDNHRQEPARVPLVTEQVSLVAVGGLVGVYCWPLFIMNDVIRVECLLRKLPLERYGVELTARDWISAYGM